MCSTLASPLSYRIGFQFFAVLVRFASRHLVETGVKMLAMVHVFGVAKLVQHDITHQMFGQCEQINVQIDIFARGAAPPTQMR